MHPRGRSKERSSSRKVTPPSPSYMSNEQFASYLADLRNNRAKRPGGARPQPSTTTSRDSVRLSMARESPVRESSVRESSIRESLGREFAARESSGRPSLGSRPPSDTSSLHQRDLPAFAGRPSMAPSVSSRYSTISGRGRDYYPERPAVAPLKPGEVVPSDTYIERGQRWMEKEEAHSLREALEDKDILDGYKEEDDERLYQAALDEAADLVWQHQNGVKPPEPGTPYRYKQHLRKDSYAHARTASAGLYGDDIQPTGLARDVSPRSVSGSSSSSDGYGSRRSRYSFAPLNIGTDSARPSVDQPRPSMDTVRSKTYNSDSVRSKTYNSDSTRSKTYHSDSVRSKGYGGLAGGPRPMVVQTHKRRSSMKRNISGEVEKPFSGAQIFEEPETATPERASAIEEKPEKSTPSLSGEQPDSSAQPLREKAKNPLNKVQAGPRSSSPSLEAKGSSSASSSASSVAKMVSRYEIHRNPPTQSRNPQYTTNSRVERPAEKQDDVPRKNGVEIRSDDIRQATSMRLKDRSPKLPTPSYVSDNPGRPIVSFDNNWKAPEEATDEKPDPRKGGGTGGTGGDGSPVRGRGRQEPVPQAPTIPSITVMEDHQPASAPAPAAAPSPTRGYRPPTVEVEEEASVPSIAVSEPQPHPLRSNPPTASPPRASPQKASPQKASPQKANQPKPNPPVPSIAVSDATPPVPTIVLPDDDGGDNTPSIPIIVTPDDDGGKPKAPAAIPTIVTPDDDNGDAKKSSSASSSSSARPLPTPGSKSTSSYRSRSHWSPAPPPPAGSRATACCHECGFPIEGRFIALAGSGGGPSGERFHPACFRCYTCGTLLEALEISPEPEAARAARLDRIRRRGAGEVLPETPGETAAEDGDARLRFFCHLDWHELFAPRCKHCKTPILGEHVVALGAHWHHGHFFCAECGDPFAPGATHVEKDGYAWCVGCQARRTERRAPKCRACRTAVVGQYVRALGGEWHDECFRCAACGGGFADGQVFPREGRGGLMEILCTPCRQRELKA